MCGEKMMKAGSNCAMLGSPPRMRGKEKPLGKGRGKSRITPAYAGKSAMVAVFCSVYFGSPPHVRGKGVVAVVVHCLHGITPAYAGKREMTL